MDPNGQQAEPGSLVGGLIGPWDLERRAHDGSTRTTHTVEPAAKCMREQATNQSGSVKITKVKCLGASVIDTTNDKSYFRHYTFGETGEPDTQSHFIITFANTRDKIGHFLPGAVRLAPFTRDPFGL